MADQFTEFKKCITSYKSQNAWCGSFDLEKTDNFKGMCYSIQALPMQSARVAKPEIAERLFERVSRICEENDIELNLIIKKKLLAKGKRK